MDGQSQRYGRQVHVFLSVCLAPKTIGLRLMLLGYFESRRNPETDPLLLWMSG